MHARVRSLARNVAMRRQCSMVAIVLVRMCVLAQRAGVQFKYDYYYLNARIVCVVLCLDLDPLFFVLSVLCCCCLLPAAFFTILR